MANKALPSRKPAPPPPQMGSRRVQPSTPTPMPVPASSSHMSSEVRADTAKLTPELRAGLLRAADAK
jgi:hypothetical protein